MASHGSEHTGDPIMLQPTSRSTNTSRKVSINSDKGLDNPAFEHNPRRKISANSDHSEVGAVRRKSILINSHNHQQHPQQQHDNISLHSG